MGSPHEMSGDGIGLRRFDKPRRFLFHQPVQLPPAIVQKRPSSPGHGAAAYYIIPLS